MKKEFDKSKKYSIKEAIELCRELKKINFNASIEAHFNLGIDPKKGEQQIRSATNLPHGTGKDIKIAAFVSKEKEDECKKAGADLVGGDDLIEEIKKSEKTNFEVAVAESEMMKKIAKIAKILGTRGLMPSPKNETVSDNPAKTIKELKKGKITLKNDEGSNLHAVIGKLNFEDEKLIENLEALIEAVKKAKPKSSKGVYIKKLSISSSMGPGIKVSV
jgi:large subunit ribosomal protein L1